VSDADQPGIVRTQADAALAFGVAPRSIRQWMADGAPRSASGYDLVAIARWHERREIARAGGVGDDEDGDGQPMAWRERKLRAEALMAEEKERQLRGELFGREQIVELTRQRLQLLVTALDALAVSAPQEICGGSVERGQEILRLRVNDMRRAFCNGEQEWLSLLEHWRQAGTRPGPRGRGRARAREPGVVG
jgi:hypothetical protein